MRALILFMLLLIPVSASAQVVTNEAYRIDFAHDGLFTTTYSILINGQNAPTYRITQIDPDGLIHFAQELLPTQSVSILRSDGNATMILPPLPRGRYTLNIVAANPDASTVSETITFDSIFPNPNAPNRIRIIKDKVKQD